MFSTHSHRQVVPVSSFCGPQPQVKKPKLARRDRGIGAAKAVHGVFDMPLMPIALVRKENVEVRCATAAMATSILHQHGGAAPSGWADNDLGNTWLASALTSERCLPDMVRVGDRHDA